MDTWVIVLIIIAAIVLVGIIVVGGRRARERQLDNKRSEASTEAGAALYESSMTANPAGERKMRVRISSPS